MNVSPSGPTLRSAAVAVGFTLCLHALCAAAAAVPQVLAPVAARDLGLPPSGVGIVAGVIALSSVPMGLFGGYLFARLSERRVCLLIAGLVALGMLIGAGAGTAARLVQLPAVFALLILGSSVLFGVALTLVNAVGAQLLFGAVPVRIRSLAFSIKQSATPIGGALVGLLLPLLLLSVSWQAVVASFAALAGAMAIAIFAMPLDDAPRGTRHAISLAELSAPVKIIWDTPRLRELGVVALCYNAYQIGMLAYLVTYLNLEIGLPLLAAGAVFSAVQIAAIAGRIGWGVSVDLRGSPRRQLGLIGLIGAASALFIGAFSPDWPLGAMLAAGALIGGSGVSWNGVFLAEVARLSPEGEIGKTTSGITVFLALGGLIGSALFAGVVALSGTYYPGFLVLALPLVVLGLRLVRRPLPNRG